MSLTVKIRGDATQFEKTMRGVNRTISGLGTKIAGLGASALAAAGAYASLSAAFGALQTASNKAADMEALTLQLTTLTGSAEKAKNMIALFVKEEQKSSLNLEDYAQAASLMLAFGVSQEDLIPIMQNLADISLGNGERFQGLARAFGQASTNGYLLKEEVNQMVERGFNPLNYIAKKTGESMQSLLKRVTAGKVTISELKQAFADATSKGGLFYKAIENGSNTMQAKLAQTQGAIAQLQVAFGTGMNEGLKVALDATTNFLPELKDKFTEAGSFFGMAISDAVNKDFEKFSMIGELIGTTVGVAMKHAFKKSVMGSIEEGIVDLETSLGRKVGKGFTEGGEDLKQNKKMQQAFGPKGAELIGSAFTAFGQYRTNYANQFEANYRSGKEYSERGNQDLADKLEAALAPILQRMQQAKFSN